MLYKRSSCKDAVSLFLVSFGKNKLNEYESNSFATSLVMKILCFGKHRNHWTVELSSVPLNLPLSKVAFHFLAIASRQFCVL